MLEKELEKLQRKIDGLYIGIGALIQGVLGPEAAQGVKEEIDTLYEDDEGDDQHTKVVLPDLSPTGWEPIQHLCDQNSLAFKYDDDTNAHAYPLYGPETYAVDLVHEGEKIWEDKIEGWEVAKKALLCMMRDFNQGHHKKI